MMEDLSQYPLELKGPNIPMVSFMNVSKGYGSLTVLENLNLNIDKRRDGFNHWSIGFGKKQLFCAC